MTEKKRLIVSDRSGILIVRERFVLADVKAKDELPLIHFRERKS